MAESVEKIGSHINAKVVEQLRKRQAVISKTSGRTDQDLLYLTSKTGWVKLSSGVNELQPHEIKHLQGGGSKLKVRGTNTLAKENVLQGGTLLNGGGLRQGIDTVRDPNQDAAYRLRLQSSGLRPMPGITSMSVKSKSTFGTLREAEVRILVWSLEDFEIIEKLYLRPGFSILLEWGHSLYHREDSQITGTVQTVDRFFRQGIKMTDILDDIKRLRTESDYNYEAMVGYVKNFSWNFTSNGGYECTVNVVSTGEILESLKARTTPGNRFPPEEFAEENSEKNIEQTKSVFHFFMDKISALKGVITNEELAKESPTLAKDLLPFVAFYGDVQLDDGYVFDTDTPMHWITLRTLFDLFNKEVALIDNTKPGDLSNGPIAKINTDYDASSKLLTSPYHFSIDPTICVLPQAPNIGDGVGTVNYVHDHTEEILGVDPNTANNTADDVLNILISIPHLKHVVDSAIDTEGKMDKSIYDIVKGVLDGVNTALGGINDLDLAYDEEYNGGTFFLIDRNNTTTNGHTAPAFTVAGLNSIFTEVNISSKLSSQISSNIAIAAQGSAQNTSENISNILKWNPNIIDRVRVTKDETKKDTSSAKDDIKAHQEKLDKWIKDTKKFFDNFNSTGGYKQEQQESAKTYFQEYMTREVVNYRIQNKQAVPGLVPVELSLKLDGIAGLKIGQTFKINSGVLPSQYQDKFGYIITGLEHSLDAKNRWETGIKTQFYLIEQPTQEEYDAATAARTSAQLDLSQTTATAGGGVIFSPGPPGVPPPALIQAMRRFGITSPLERAHFLAQCSHESGGFKWVKEFANGVAYEGRKDLGNTQPGDGPKYKGRGYIQLTGRANYQAFANYLKKQSISDDIMTNPDLVATKYASEAACYWWKFLSRNITNLATAGDLPRHVEAVSRRVNGPSNLNRPPNHIADRQNKFSQFWSKIQQDNSTYA